MLRIDVEKKDLNLKDWVKRGALATDFTPANLITKSCVLYHNDKPIVIYKNLDDEGFDSADIVSALKQVEYYTETRTGGLKTTSRIFGYAPRNTIRKDYCSSTSLAQTHPKENKIVCDYGVKMAALYSENAPDTYNMHAETAQKVLDEWRIENTPFTSGIINKNNPLKYHFDSGNFKGVYSCMLGFKQGIEGGHLCMPEYDCALEIANNSVTIFDGQAILHGVTPMKLLSPDSHRYTIVYYSLQRMWDCLPLNEEVARIRNLKMQREEKRAKRDLEKDQEANNFEGVV